jgi:hypothetical protein
MKSMMNHHEESLEGLRIEKDTRKELKVETNNIKPCNDLDGAS